MNKNKNNIESNTQCFHIEQEKLIYKNVEKRTKKPQAITMQMNDAVRRIDIKYIEVEKHEMEWSKREMETYG